MSTLDELYRQVILDHYRSPRHRGSLNGPHIHAEGLNPSCGDEFSIDLMIEDGVIVDAAIQGQGCSISQASGSMMAEAIIGKTTTEVRQLTETFKLMMGIEEGGDPLDPEKPGVMLGDLEALQGVKKFPVRIKCANLPWTTLAEALNRSEE
jgi:nitrogen fixation protein NifU and related proteins